MFTGIVQAVGAVTEVTPRNGDVELCIHSSTFDLSTSAIGDSISCSGCCLTITKLEPQSFYVDVSRESLDVTTLHAWRVGTEINLERALRAGDALGGHYVTGHVDGIGTVSSLRDDARSVRVDFEIPRALGRYVACKGSICVDGVSLTVNGVSDQGSATRFDVNLIPHTRAQTIMRAYQVGTRVNIEIDIIARYLERMQTGKGSRLESLG